MMTVGELKNILADYDEDLPVCIGLIQTYGSNFATELDTHKIPPFLHYRFIPNQIFHFT